MYTNSYLVTDGKTLHQALATREHNADKLSLVQLFSTQSKELVREYSALLRQRLPNSTIIGQSASHLIHLGDISTQGTLILISELAAGHITSAFVAASGDDNQDSRLLATSLSLSSNSKAVLSFAHGINPRGPLYNMFDSVQPGIVTAGGIAVATSSGAWLLLDQEIYSAGCVAAALHGEALHATQAYFTEWHPIGRSLTVTKADGCHLQQLDGLDCQQVYRHYLANGKPLGVEEIRAFPLMQGQSVTQDILTPVKLHDDGSIEFNRPVNEGVRLRFSYSHPALTLEQVRQQAQSLQQEQPQALFGFCCTSRLKLMHGNEELLPLHSVAPLSGVYCGGELCRNDSGQRLLNHSMTYLALREGAPDNPAYNPLTLPSESETTSPLFTLLRHAIGDADAMQANMQQRLESKTQELTQSYRIDNLTQLPNRIALEARMQRMHLNEHLLCMKLTNFPQINEKYGYRIGDQLLVDVSRYFARKLDELIPHPAQLFSTGVGEWACLFKSGVSATLLRQKIYNFTLELEQVNFEPKGIPASDHLSVSVSAGLISRRDFPDIPPDKVLFKGIEARRLARNNNRHLYSAKQVQAEKESQQSQLSWLSCVSKAIQDNDIITYAQPIVKAGTHQQVSLECLVRIRDGERIINPGQFLPAIAGTHLYTRLSRQMIENTFTLMRDQTSSFSINLSPQDLMSDKTIQLLERNLLTLKDSGRVGLEILESEQIKDYGRMLEVCGHLRALGARIIVDDFGSGYSNIDEIIKLEPQIVKLDGSLIKTIDSDLRQRKVAQTMVQLCEVFGAKTVAEFVHNQAVCQAAEDLGIDYLQGYYLGEPYQVR